jgi:hypothetical protein
MFRRIAAGLVAGVLSAAVAQAQTPQQTPPAQQPPPAGQPAQQAQTVSNKREFPNDGGLVLNFIKPDKTADFEATMTKL